MIYFYFMAVLCATANAGNVLFLTPFGSPSHKNLFTPIAYALGEKKHNVSLVSILKPKESSPHVTEVVLENLLPAYKELVYWLCKEGFEGPTEEVLEGLTSTANTMCEIVFQDKLVQSWVNRKDKFDIVIVDGVLHDCLFPLAHLMGKKVGALNTAALFSWIANSINSPYPPSFISFYLNAFKARMNFWERMINAYSSLIYDFEMESSHYPVMEVIIRKYFPQALSIKESYQKLSLVLCNGEPLLGSVRPSVPTVVNMGGIHCRPGQDVGKEFEDIIQSSDDGFIIFSLGSIFNESLISEERKQHIFTAFSKLKFKIIWKINADLGHGVPSNVKIVKWIPQQDLLNHPKCMAFITHSGLLSLQEAVYHAVPMVVIPLFAEQPMNAAHVEDLGIAVRLVWNEFTADELVKAVETVTTSEYRSRLLKYSAIFKDVPGGSLNQAVFWTEYVMRNEISDSVLKVDISGLSFIEYFSLDVIAFLLLVAFVGLVLSYKCMKIACFVVKKRTKKAE